jgi:hypothetical protein
LAQVRDQIDGDRNQDYAKEIRQQSVKKSFPSDLTIDRLNLRPDVGHPHGVGEVGEVAVGQAASPA